MHKNWVILFQKKKRKNKAYKNEPKASYFGEDALKKKKETTTTTLTTTTTTTSERTIHNNTVEFPKMPSPYREYKDSYAPDQAGL